MITLLSYATADMSISQQKLHESFHAIMGAKHKSLDFNKARLWAFFSYACNFNKKILQQPRGAGYWLWKPILIYKALLHEVEEGDYLMYCDAGIQIVHNLQPLLDLNQDIVLFNNEWRHVDWCKMDVMESMIPGWAHADRPDQQCQASVILLRKTDFVIDFIHEWLTWCMVPGFIDDSPSQRQNLPGFKEHRHDQAILTCLAIRNGIGIKQHWWPAQYQTGVKHKYPDDDYPVLFEHHRKRNPGTHAVDGNGNPQPEWGEE